MVEHTKTPWKSSGIVITSGNGSKLVALACDKPDGAFPTELNRANAAFIVRACNVHDELYAALEAAINWRGLDGDGISDPVREQLYAAIAKARGEK